MNSMIRRSTLLASALCAAVLTGCNAVENVPDEPTAEAPVAVGVLGGKIENLGSRRALVLKLLYDNTEIKLCRELNTATNVQQPVECKHYGIPDEQYSPFNFGSLPLGKAYTISVKTQPFSKTCLFANGTTVLTGNLKAGDKPDIAITCTDNTPPAHYTVTANISAAVRSNPDLKVILTTESGTCPVLVNGRAQIVFSPAECPNQGSSAFHQGATFLFDNGVSLPNFTWRVTATIPGATVVDAPTNCVVTGDAGSRTVANTGGNIADDGTADRTLIPNANQAVTVSACGFAINVQADYSLSSTETVVPTIAVGDDIKVVLRSQPYGQDVAVAKIPNFTATNVSFKVPDAAGDPTGTDFQVKSNPDAYYEAVVTKSPAGMTCVLGGSAVSTTTAASNSTRTPTGVFARDGGAVLVRYPSSGNVPYKWVINKVVRCRLIAANPNALRGAYWQHRKTTTIATQAGVTTSTVVYVRARNLLTFFENGEYLFGSRTNTASTNGPEHGFYLYTKTQLNKTCLLTSATGGVPSSTTNQPANSICFMGFTDINGSSAGGLNGLHATGGTTSAPIPRQLTNVVRSTTEVVPGVVRKTITALWSDTTTGGITLAAAVADPASPASLTVTVPLGTNDVAAGSHTTVTTLVNAINAVANPGAVPSANVAVAVGNEIQIRGLTGGTTLSGPAVATLGLPASVPAGQVAVSTGVTSALALSTRTVVELVLEEVGADPMVTETTNLLDGAWVAWDWQVRPAQPAPVLDQRRIVVFQHGLYTLFHMGVNGLPNMQDTCFTGAINELTGSLVRQRGSGTSPVDLCHLRQITLRNGETLKQVLDVQKALAGRDADCNIVDLAVGGGLTSTCVRLGGTAGDVPNATLSPPLDKDHPARFPQTMSPGFDTRYSFVDYEVRPANSVPSDPVCPTVDKLTFWDTQNGYRKELMFPSIPRLVLCRITAN